MRITNQERHYSHSIGWLRAAVLGANDGIVSTASLIVGVAAAGTPKTGILIAGVAGLTAGAMSMAAGEYVSVCSQSDTEKADLAREVRELEADREFELNELAEIYQKRGVRPDLSKEVAEQLMAHDALGAHARDELGITEQMMARPAQAALTSAASFTVGAALPLMTVFSSPLEIVIPAVSVFSLIFLAGLGYISASLGGAPRAKAVARVVFWGALALALTALIGRWFGTVV